LPFYGTDIHSQLEELIALAPIFLGLIHCGVGIFDKRLRVPSVVRIDAHANARRDVEIVLIDRMYLRHSLQHPLRRKGGIFGVLQLRKQNDEFISTLPADRVGTANATHQALCNRLKKFVADRMAKGIVDIFEAVQIEKQHRDLAHATRGQRDRTANPVVQQHSVG
jgi:hypothetical protein